MSDKNYATELTLKGYHEDALRLIEEKKNLQSDVTKWSESYQKLQNHSDKWRTLCGKMKADIVNLHIQVSANKVLPHVLCGYCNLLAEYEREYDKHL